MFFRQELENAEQYSLPLAYTVSSGNESDDEVWKKNSYTVPIIIIILFVCILIINKSLHIISVFCFRFALFSIELWLYLGYWKGVGHRTKGVGVMYYLPFVVTMNRNTHCSMALSPFTILLLTLSALQESIFFYFGVYSILLFSEWRLVVH